MDWDLSQFGMGESIDIETAIIVLVATARQCTGAFSRGGMWGML